MATLLMGWTAWAGPESDKAKTSHLDAYGDPLPPRAILRIGTVRLRHGDFVNCVAFSPDGKMVVSGSWDGTLRSWEVATGKELHCFQGHRSAVMSLNISKDGKTLASISQDFTVRLWDLGTGKELRKLDAPRGGYYDLSFSPDGQTLASCGQNLTIWETKTYRKLHEFELNIQGWFTCLAFSPDGKTLVIGSEHGVIRFWDTTTWKEVRKIQTHAKEMLGVKSLAFSPDGKFLASAGEDGLLSLRDAKTGEPIRSFVKRQPRGCSRLAFSPDSKTLAWSYGAEGIIRVFEVPSGKEVRQFKEPRHSIAAIAFSPDGKIVASAADSSIRLWGVPSGKELLPPREPLSPIFSLVFCADDKMLAGISWRSMIYCWDAVTGKTLHRLDGQSEKPWLIAAPSDGPTLFSADRDGFVRRWDLVEAKELQCFRVKEGNTPVAVSPDGKMLAAENFAQQSGRLYDLQSGKEVGRFEPACDAIFFPDGKSLVLHVPGQGLVRWDIARNKVSAWLARDNIDNRCMAVSPDGKIFASGTNRHGLHRWDLSTNEPLSSLDGQQKTIESVAFSPDGRMLASGGEDGTIWLWEMLTGRSRGVLRGHRGPVLFLTFSRDGRRLASGSKDTTALVWDLTDGIGTAPAKELAAEQLNDLWRDLAAEDAAKAYRSIWLLARAPKQALPFLQTRLRPIPTPDPKRVAQLLADLDSERFKVRTKARAELAELGETVAQPLHAAADKRPSIEVVRQVKELLEKLKTEKRTPSAERVRSLRAVEVLEHIGNSEARRVLATLAEGTAEAQRTQEAKASLQRLAPRAKRSR